MSTRKNAKGFWIGALAGGVIGSIAALLFAPKAGKELRKDIAVQAQKVGDSTAKAAEYVGDATGRLAKGIGTGATEIADRTKLAAGQVVSAFKGMGRNARDEETVVIASARTEGEAEAESGQIEGGAARE